MNEEQIRQMEAGRELDRLVAQKVMGWVWYDGAGTAGPSYWMDTSGEFGEFAHLAEFEPSTDIAAAWEVVEKLHEQYTVSIRLSYVDRHVYCDIIGKCITGDPVPHIIAISRERVAPLAICMVALQVQDR